MESQLFTNIYDLTHIVEKLLIKNLDLTKVPAPLFVSKQSGLNDDLTGTETKVEFTAKHLPGMNFEVVQSLAKWKRYALKKFKLSGILTDMVAIRKDEYIDLTHSLQVEQWDWEHTINESERTLDTLYCYAKKLFKIIKEVDIKFNNILDGINELYCEEADKVKSIYETVKNKKICFISKIGYPERAPDYDDWNLNGDLYVWCDSISSPLELSSMGIRVNDKTLSQQLLYYNIRNITPYHKSILSNSLPLTIGGGIGKNRLCMYILQLPTIKDYIDIY